MNKFYKTSYPKTSSINQILKNKKQIKKQTFRKEDLLASHLNTYKDTLNAEAKLKPRFHLDNKIEIDSELLFTKNESMKQKYRPTDRLPEDRIGNNNSLHKEDRKSVFEQMQKRKQQNKTQSRFYDAEQTPKIRVRPQSKQENRTRLLSATGKRQQLARPQTSKGSRKNVCKQRLLSMEDQNDIDIIISKNRKKSVQNQEEKIPLNERGKKKYNFQTSIDDQFLSLFAN